MALEAKAVILDAGLPLVNGTLTGYSRFAAHSFKLGSGAGYEPLKSDTQVNGTLVYTGAASLITTRVINSNTVRYTLTIPEDAGPFNFGSIVLFANAFDGIPLPFLEAALPFTIPKIAADPNISNATPFPLPGTRMVISFFVSHNTVTDSTDVQVTVQAPSISNLPFYDDETVLPPPSAQPWNQFVLHNHTLAGAPALVTKRADNTYWGLPLYQNVQSPRFGIIDGGVSGDGYQTDQRGYVWGHFYTTPNNAYKGVIGGMGYVTANLTSEPAVIGGQGY